MGIDFDSLREFYDYVKEGLDKRVGYNIRHNDPNYMPTPDEENLDTAVESLEKALSRLYKKLGFEGSFSGYDDGSYSVGFSGEGADSLMKLLTILGIPFDPNALHDEKGLSTYYFKDVVSEVSVWYNVW